MSNKIPKKVEERIKSGLKTFVDIIREAKARDINESDTVILVSDFISSVLGWDKYSNITTEFAIRSTFCDLAVRDGDDIKFLIEVKAIGLDLKENHVRQAIDYAANNGTDWVLLTNGQVWHAYKVLFQKPIDFKRVFELDLGDVGPRDFAEIYKLFLLSPEGTKRKAIEDYHKKSQLTNRFTIAAVIRSDVIVHAIAREIKKIGKDIRVNDDEILVKIEGSVLKREVVEGEEAGKAMTLVKRHFAAIQRKKTAKKKREMVTEQSADEEGQGETPDTTYL